MARRLLMHSVLAGLLFTWLLAGCHKPAVREKPVPDPLLTSKKPIEGRAHATDGLSPGRDDVLPTPPSPGIDAVKPRAAEAPVVRLLGVRQAAP
jgi:hypothetical protein